MIFVKSLQNMRQALSSLRSVADKFQSLPRNQIMTAGHVSDMLTEARDLAGDTTPQADAALLNPYWNALAMVGLLSECSQYVSDDLRDRIEIALEHAAKYHGMTVSKIGKRIHVDKIPQPGSKDTISYRKSD